MPRAYFIEYIPVNIGLTLNMIIKWNGTRNDININEASIMLSCKRYQTRLGLLEL